EPRHLPGPAPAHRALPALTGTARRLRGPGPARPGDGTPAAERLRGGASPHGPAHLRRPEQPGRAAGSPRLPGPDRPRPLPLRRGPAPGDGRTGGPRPGPPPDPLDPGRPHRDPPPPRHPPGPPQGPPGRPPPGRRPALILSARPALTSS